MTISREQFIKRLEEVGFILKENNVYIYDKWCNMFLYSNKDFFVYQPYEEWEAKDNPELYSFDELEQFLIDNGIVEKEFDAHEYLIGKGFISVPTYTPMHTALEAIQADTRGYKINNYILFIDFYKNNITVKSTTNFFKIALYKEGDSNNSVLFSYKFFIKDLKESCDKAIKLIESLEQL